MTNITNPSTQEKTEKRPSGMMSVGGALQRVLYERPLLLIALIIGLSIFMTVRYPEAFPHWDNFAAVLLDTAQNGILTVGMMILLVGGVFDLSVGSTLAVASYVFALALVAGVPAVVAMVLAWW